MYNTRVSYNVNYELWVIMMCQRNFTSFNRCTTLVGNVDNGRDYACEGAGCIQKNLCIFPSILL